jgi:hypothetical protein
MSGNKVNIQIEKVVQQLNPSALTQSIAPIFAVYRAQGLEQKEAFYRALVDLQWVEAECQKIGERERPVDLENL